MQDASPFDSILDDDLLLHVCRGTDASLALMEEREATASMIEKRALEFLTGRSCARRGLRALGLPDAPLLASGESRIPSWPDGTVGSISHTDGICMAAVGRAEHVRGIGIDVERRDAVKPKLERYIATTGEAERHADVPRWRTLAFSAKEALFKCLNPVTGVWLEFRDVEVLEIGAGTFRLRVSPKDADPFERSGRWIETDEYIMTSVVWRASE